MTKPARYNITDIAKELGVTRQTIYYWIRKRWVAPKRDYRNYPVFTDKDLLSVKRWQHALRNGPIKVKEGKKRRPPAKTAPNIARLTWEELQKMLYK